MTLSTEEMRILHSLLHDVAKRLQYLELHETPDAKDVIASSSAELANALTVEHAPNHWKRFVESAYDDLSSASYVFEGPSVVSGSTGSRRVSDAVAKIKTILGEIHLYQSDENLRSTLLERS